MRKFLTARWQDLIMVNYEVPPKLLESHVPAGTKIDLHEGRCFVSLVGFMFLDTRVLGVPIPFHINFEEVNLRLYVRRECDNEIRRGVVFVKEIVPRAAIAAVARTLYGEPYEAWRMGHTRTESEIGYTWTKRGCDNRIGVNIGQGLGIPAEGSHGEFIIEHYWGYTRRGPRRTDEYRVEHPKWELFSASDPEIIVDFGAIYGPEFEFLGRRTPHSVLLAKGSEIAVYKGRSLGR
jgi:uncharacterized protein YqjF (DUF2071 family)